MYGCIYYIYMNICGYIYIYKYKNINFSQIFRLFSKPSTVCVDKALDEKFTNTAEIKN